MSLSDRILPREEWSRLAGCDLAGVVGQLDPRSSQIVVVEDESGAIVGCWALVTMLHAEGVWIAPEYRGKGSVARRLWTSMRALVHAAGRQAVLTAANSPEVHRLLTRQRSQPLPQEYLLCL